MQSVASRERSATKKLSMEDYMSKHQVMHKLNAVLTAVAMEQPADPVRFIASRLLAGASCPSPRERGAAASRLDELERRMEAGFVLTPPELTELSEISASAS